MSRTGTGPADVGSLAGSETQVVPEELRALLATISHQIETADERHTGILQEMRDRLAAMSREAEQVRTDVPYGSEAAFARIENGLAQLAMRIDAVDEAQSELRSVRYGQSVFHAPAAAEPALAPAALKSAASPEAVALMAHAEPARSATGAAAIDPFDLIGESFDDEANEPWDEGSAEALTRIYEESDAALVRSSPRSEQPASDGQAEAPGTPEISTINQPMGAPADEPVMGMPSATSMPQMAAFNDERAWLDARLSEIAARIEQSLADMNPALSMESLGERFGAFEERMGSVLGDVALRTDVESLRILEGQITELAAHLEQTEAQLGRLDGIEQQLQVVIEHLAEQQGSIAAPASSYDPVDMRALATTTADEVAQRIAASLGAAQAPAGDERRFEEINGLLRNLMDDRRQNDEQTYSMLDTVQQAMIRLLDRIDALEVSHVRQQNADVPAMRGLHAADMAHEPKVAAPRYAAMDEPAPAFGFAPQSGGTAPAVPDDAFERTAGPSAVPHHDEPAAPAPRSPVDKLRQDFIADAQRAKLRAAAAAEAEAEADAGAAVTLSANKAARGLPRPRMPAPDPVEPDAATPGSSRKIRLTALALALVIAVSGVSLLMKSRASAPSAPVPAAVTDVSPVIEIPAKPAADAGPANASPAAGFEVPADDAAGVPAPVPMNAAPADPAEPAASNEAPASEAAPQALPRGGGGPETNIDALGIDGELSDGEVLENRPQTPGAGLAPEGIVLQDSIRKPSAQQLIHLQNQQKIATLSSRLGNNASRLSPADLMPEEVAKVRAQNIVYQADADADALPAQMAAIPASLNFDSLESATTDVPKAPVNASVNGVPSALALPPATVGPLSLRLAAANGDPSAAFEVGARLAEGKGTTQNFKEAMTWYQRSAAKGFAQAQYRLGTLYERGLGVKADPGRARAWYQRAAEQGNVKAMHNLAVLSAGRDSGSPDYTTAAQWFQSAADHGLADSQYNLAVLHENGLGVAKDPSRAYIWYALAAKSGDKEAARRRDALARDLDPKARQSAEVAVSSFTPKIVIPIVNDARVAGEDWKKRQGASGNG